jgi:c-di-GMP-binding flagellar brake protein YcgR
LQTRPGDDTTLVVSDRPSPRALKLAQTAQGEAEERRASERTVLDADVTIYAATGAAGREYIGVASDISRSGMFVSTFARVSVSARVTLKFRLPEGLVICEAEVRRVRTASEGVTGGLGLTFLDLSELDRALVNRYCRELVTYHSDIMPRQSHRPIERREPDDDIE